MMFTAAITAAKKHAREQYPKESCGFVVDDMYVPLENNAQDPEKAFSIADAEYIKYSSKIQAVIHSHPDGPACPSEADMVGQASMGVPWGIVVINAQQVEEVFWWGEGVETPDLIGRSFRHGVTDCYSLIRDYYLKSKKVKIPDFPRGDSWWVGGGRNLYMDNFEKAGFKRISASEAREGDVFLAQVRSPVYNHGGVLVENGLILHHLHGRLSCREPLVRWQKYITVWLRYVG